MESNVLNKLIEEFQELSIEEKEYVNKIFKKQIIEAKRKLLEHRVDEAMDNLNQGKVKRGSVKDLFEDLEND